MRRRRIHSQRARVVRRLARQRCRRGELALLLRRRERVLEVLQREVLEVILAQDPDAVHEPLQDVLEHPALAPDLDEHLEAVEGALALPHRLEVIGPLLEQAHRGDGGLARLPGVAALLGAARQVELHEGRVVRVRAAAPLARLAPGERRRDLRQARPQRARPLPVVGLLAVDGGGGDEPRVLHLARGRGHVPCRRKRARPVDWRDRRERGARAPPRVGVRQRQIPADRQRAARVPPLRQRVAQRTEHREVIDLCGVRLRRGRQERRDCSVHVAARHRGARALPQLVEIVGHAASLARHFTGGGMLGRSATRSRRRFGKVSTVSTSPMAT